MTVALGASWVLPPQRRDRSRPGTVLVATGVLWDAVRTPLDSGRHVLDALTEDPVDVQLLGPVFADTFLGWLYWLISPGHSNTWPDDARLLGAGSWLALPESATTTVADASWLHLPEQRIVSGPAWLAAALDTHRRAA